MRCVLAVAASLSIAALACGCRRAEPAGAVRAHLESGDSVELVGWSTAVVPGEPDGLLLAYRPFTPMQDTAKLRQTAVALWHAYARPVAERRGVSWVVLQAQSPPARGAVWPVTKNSSYGVVLDRAADGSWYFHKSGLPVE
jgi:hypothetical protein